MRAKDFPMEAAIDIAQDWNLRYCDPPLTEREIHRRVERGWVEWLGSTSPDKTPEEVMGVEPNAGEWEVMSLDDLLAWEAVHGALHWMVPNVFVDQGIHIISCPPGGAKSWLMLELARALVSGMPWLGIYEIPAQNVLYVDEEMGTQKAVNRIRRLDFGRAASFFYMGMQGVRVDSAEQLARLLALAREQNIKTIFFDTLSRIHQKDENDNSRMRALFKSLSQLTEAGITVILAHHDRKGGGDDEGRHQHQKMRGASEIAAMCDMAFTIEKNADGSFTLKATKTRLISEDEGIKTTFVIEDSEDRSGVTIRALHDEEKFERQRAKTEEAMRIRIFEALANGPLSTNMLRSKVVGSPNLIIEVARKLAADGTLAVAEGERGARLYSLPQHAEEETGE